MQSRLFQSLNGKCPYCGGKVNIVEGMVYEYTLGYSGEPNNLESESYRVAAYCKKCSKCLFVMPNESGGYTVYPEPDKVNVQRLIQRDKVLRSSVLGNTLMDGNPFHSEEDDCPF